MTEKNFHKDSRFYKSPEKIYKQEYIKTSEDIYQIFINKYKLFDNKCKSTIKAHSMSRVNTTYIEFVVSNTTRYTTHEWYTDIEFTMARKYINNFHEQLGFKVFDLKMNKGPELHIYDSISLDDLKYAIGMLRLQ